MNYHGGAAIPDRITPDRRGLGAPLTAYEAQAAQQSANDASEVADKPKPPPVPYRANTTGLSTGNLPKPPVRRMEEDGQITGTIAVNPSGAPKPALPPRLPPRQNSVPAQRSPSPPPPYFPVMPSRGESRQSGSGAAVSRLEAAGVNVTALGIGQPESHGQRPTGGPSQPFSQDAEYASKFRKMATQSPTSESSLQGTSFADKQAAFRTAQSFRTDPSSVSFADARNMASTADNFRQRHGDQVASGWKSANALNRQYGITSTVNKYTDGGLPENQAVTGGPSAPFSKSATPQPPKRMADDDGSSAASPPPIPFSSKPRS